MAEAVDMLVEIPVRAARDMESQSGIQNSAPKIWGRFSAPAGKSRIATIVMHPTSNFMGHYLIQPLVERGMPILALNSRYAGNDMMLLMEHVIRDLGAGVKWLRDRGYEKVVFIGNSGGAALGSFYQSQAENLTAILGADGRPTELSAEDLPPVDGLVLTAAHPGRSRLLAEWIDPSVIDENDPMATDPEFDIYNCDVRPPFSEEYVARFRAAQVARRDRIESRALARLRRLEADPEAASDEAILVFRTHSDPRFLDLTLDANDRPVGSIWGDARQINYGPNAMGRVSTLRSWLSQWSSRSLADGPTCLGHTSVPVLLHRHTADGSTFPSTYKLWADAAGDRLTDRNITSGTHYLHGQPELIAQSADSLTGWARDHFGT